MRTISAVWSACGPSPQLRTFTEAVLMASLSVQKEDILRIDVTKSTNIFSYQKPNRLPSLKEGPGIKVYRTQKGSEQGAIVCIPLCQIM